MSIRGLNGISFAAILMSVAGLLLCTIMIIIITCIGFIFDLDTALKYYVFSILIFALFQIFLFKKFFHNQIFTDINLKINLEVEKRIYRLRFISHLFFKFMIRCLFWPTFVIDGFVVIYFNRKYKLSKSINKFSGYFVPKYLQEIPFLLLLSFVLLIIPFGSQSIWFKIIHIGTLLTAITFVMLIMAFGLKLYVSNNIATPAANTIGVTIIALLFVWVLVAVSEIPATGGNVMAALGNAAVAMVDLPEATETVRGLMAINGPLFNGFGYADLTRLLNLILIIGLMVGIVRAAIAIARSEREAEDNHSLGVFGLAASRKDLVNDAISKLPMKGWHRHHLAMTRDFLRQNFEQMLEAASAANIFFELPPTTPEQNVANRFARVFSVLDIGLPDAMTPEETNALCKAFISYAITRGAPFVLIDFYATSFRTMGWLSDTTVDELYREEITDGQWLAKTSSKVIEMLAELERNPQITDDFKLLLFDLIQMLVNTASSGPERAILAMYLKRIYGSDWLIQAVQSPETTDESLTPGAARQIHTLFAETAIPIQPLQLWEAMLYNFVFGILLQMLKASGHGNIVQEQHEEFIMNCQTLMKDYGFGGAQYADIDMIKRVSG